MPMIKGVKSASERFAGGEFLYLVYIMCRLSSLCLLAVDTFTIEACMQNGWALQCGTAHFLGTNFAEAFDVTFQSPEGERKHVWATSWGVSTRLIGALIMTHSDDVRKIRIARYICRDQTRTCAAILIS